MPACNRRGLLLSRRQTSEFKPISSAKIPIAVLSVGIVGGQPPFFDHVFSRRRLKTGVISSVLYLNAKSGGFIKF